MCHKLEIMNQEQTHRYRNRFYWLVVQAMVSRSKEGNENVVRGRSGNQSEKQEAGQGRRGGTGREGHRNGAQDKWVKRRQKHKK